MGAKSPCKIAWVGIGPLVYAPLVTASPRFGKSNSITVSRFGVCDPTSLVLPSGSFLAWGAAPSSSGACPWPSAQLARFTG